MAVDGLSLLGFMTERQALSYLEMFCNFQDKSKRALTDRWREAGKLRGSPFSNAGKLTPQEMPREHQKYLHKVTRNSRFWDTVVNYDWSFCLVDVNALLAFQWDISTVNSATLCGPVGSEPTMEELLEKCLPCDVDDIPFTIADIPDKAGKPPKGALIKADDLNLRLQGSNKAEDPTSKIRLAGAMFGPSVRYVQVVKYDGMYYLRNGYHRAYGFGIRKALQIPCILWEANSFPETGALGGGGTFEKTAFYCGNSPTLGHYIQNRAYPVKLKQKKRVIKIEWAESIELN